MTIEIDFAQLLGALFALFVLFGGVCFGLFKLLLAQNEKHQDERWVAMQKHQDDRWTDMQAQLSKIPELELRIAQWRIEFTEKFIGREDYVRNQTVLEGKLDRVSTQLRVLELQGAKSQ